MRGVPGCCACFAGLRRALGRTTALASPLANGWSVGGLGGDAEGVDAEGREGGPVPEPPEPPAGQVEALSRRQQKKQVLRDARQERKGQKKVQKQAGALDGALAALESALAELLAERAPAAGDAAALRGCLCSLFGVTSRYRELPLAHGPLPTEGLEALGAALVRPPKYSAKFLPQEYSLLHKIWAMLGGDCRRAGVLDIGAGNANCAVLAAVMLGLTVICVERESPRDELRAEALLPEELRQRVVRFESDIADFDAATLQEVAAAHGLQRLVLVAKHPCGIGVDRSIACAARLRSPEEKQAGGPEVLGAVLATCCTNKLSQDDLRVSRVAEFAELYAGDLPRGGVGGAGEGALQRVVEVMSRCSAWRSAAGSEGNAVQDGQLQWAELFEDCLQAPRLRRLGQVFGAAAEVRFAPRGCTLQDRCLLASAAPLPAGLWAHGEVEADEAFLAQLRASGTRLLAASGPIDCRPRGLKSERYGFDYTAMDPADE